tara:strand:+ start:3774 stop:4130 length:357 start_codon:yes stop_codon:yes gene_type:complete
MKTSLFIYALLQGLLVAFSYDIEEIVERGGQRGSSYYDWPTANIPNQHLFPCGVYGAESNYGQAVCMVLWDYKIECHIRNFKGNLYGKELKLRNLERIMNDRFAAIINTYCESFLTDL